MLLLRTYVNNIKLNEGNQNPYGLCATALPITLDSTFKFSASGTILQALSNDTNLYHCQQWDGNPAVAEWFTFTAPISGQLVADMCSSDYDSTVNILPASCSASSVLVCDDDNR